MTVLEFNLYDTTDYNNWLVFKQALDTVRLNLGFHKSIFTQEAIKLINPILKNQYYFKYSYFYRKEYQELKHQMLIATVMFNAEKDYVQFLLKI